MRTIRALFVVICTISLFASSLVAEDPKAAKREAWKKEMLRRFDKDNDGQLNEQEQEALRQYRKERQNAASQPAKAKIPPGVKLIADIEYAKVKDHVLLLDIYLPEKKADQPLPVIMWVHGGAWIAGNKSGCPIAHMADKGYAVVSINYRLTGTACHPAQINDCKAAVRWVRAHAAEYRFDPDRVGACGGSAGGHLVALLGTSGDIKELEGDVGGNLKYSSRVRAVCDLCGPTDFTREDYVRDRPTTQPAILEKALIRFLNGPWDDNRQAANTASPVFFISKDDPPFLIIHGDADKVIPVKHSQRLYDMLKAAGLDATLHIVKDGTHGVGGYPGIQDKIVEFFDKHLKKQTKE